MFGIKRLKAHIKYLKENRVLDRELIIDLENRLVHVLGKLNSPNVEIAKQEVSPYQKTSTYDLRIKLDYCVDCEDYETANEIKEELSKREEAKSK